MRVIIGVLLCLTLVFYVAPVGGQKKVTNIDECASDPCQYGGTCTDGVNGYTCECVAGYTGDDCETDIDECASDPCQYGGTCTDGVNGYTCECVAGYTGDDCETDIDECASDPCQYGGTCTDGVNGYTCECVAGYTGDDCETDIDECASDPCQYGGTCTDGVNGYTCECVAGYTGDDCETDIDECASDPCQYGGTCTDGVNGYTCECVAGYTGDDCETDIDECASDPCQYGGTCTDGVNGYTCECVAGYTGDDCETDIDECASDPCQYGGTCTDGVNGYTCECVAGYTGDDCETDIDECASDPCQYGGTCTDGVNGYTCECVAGYTGDDCETDIDECASDPCQYGGTCTDGVNGYTCECVAGYTGDDCETDTNECEGVTCDNGGTCVDGINEYSCDCADGFFGDHCETGKYYQYGLTSACQARTDPPEVERGNVYCNDSGPLYPIGTFCVHGCNNTGGYFRSSGDKSRTCQLGGTWDGEHLVCLKACSARTDPPEGGGNMYCTNSGPPYPVGTVCTHQCDNGGGFFLNSGDESRTCQVGGTWGGVDLVCAVACSARTDPPEGERGSIFCTNSGPPYAVGTLCIHQCDNEQGFFTESGDTQRTCLVGGTWDGADLVCGEACSARTDPPEGGGNMYCTNSGPPYPVDTVCTHQCDNGGGFFLNSGDESRTCQVGGTWGGVDLVCADDCPARTDPPVHQRDTVEHCDNAGPPYPIGTTCTHSCNGDLGFVTISGDGSRTCQLGGTWDGADLVCGTG
uniref:Uncharacterized protein n=1 Tax=Branchiostoma floridae TaxID=7739 RepID=C3Y5F1_BRAFL|eukprot:XP_002608188.1 hypothetical protein BRAFLDRAFT_125860 [Branchiostoma floridae]